VTGPHDVTRGFAEALSAAELDRAMSFFTRAVAARTSRSIGKKPKLGPGESPDALHAEGRENRRTMTAGFSQRATPGDRLVVRGHRQGEPAFRDQEDKAR